MARTGRFGRLPTESPDLSSQIASLMEQYAAAEDRNILDAWTNGGTYKGKKVTDRDILRHYRKRRDSYDKDEPEYDQWNQDLWQVRYQVADEKVQASYRQGKIGPRAVANHYKRWANKMPKNSSFYRNLMAAYGDYMKAAAVGSGSGGGGGGGGSAYAALQNRIRDLDRQQRESTEFMELLSEYARRRQYIGPSDDFTTPGAWDSYEAADMQLMLDGFNDWEPFKEWAAGQRAMGYTTFKGHEGFQRDDILRAINENIRLSKAKVRAYQNYPGDMSSYAQGEQNNIRNMQAFRRQIKHGGLIDTKADWNAAWEDFLGQPGDPDDVGYTNAKVPSDVVADVDMLIRETNKLRRRADLNGDAPTALFAEAFSIGLRAARDGTATDPSVQKQVQQAMEYLQQQYPDLATDFAGSMFLSGGSIADFAAEIQIHYNGAKMLKDGTGVLVQIPQPTKGEQALGAIAPPSFRVWSMERSPEGQVVLRDPDTDDTINVGGKTAIVSDLRKDENGNWEAVPVLIEATPIVTPDGRELGVLWEHNGQRLWGQIDPDNPGLYLNTTFSPWAAGGANEEYLPDKVVVTAPGDVLENEVSYGDMFPMRPSLGDEAIAFQERIAGLDAEGPDLPEAERAQVEAGQQRVLDAFNNEDPTAILDDPVARREALAFWDAQSGVRPGTLASYEGTEDYDAAERAVVAEILRQKGYDIPFDESQAGYLNGAGSLRVAGDAQLLRLAGRTGDDLAARAEIQRQAEEAGIPFTQWAAQNYYDPNTTTGIPAEAIDATGVVQQVRDNPEGVAATPKDQKSQWYSEYRSTGDGLIIRQTQGERAAFESYIEGLADAGTYSVELGFIMQDIEKREILHQDPNIFLPLIALSASSQAEAELMLKDTITVLTENGLDDQLKMLAEKSGFREVEQGFAVGVATAQQNLKEAIALKFGNESDLFGAGFNVFGGSQAVPRAGSFYPAAAKYTADVLRPSETSVQPREQVAAEPIQPEMKLPQPLAQVAGVIQKGVVKTASTVNRALANTYIGQTSSAANIASSTAAIGSIKPVNISVPKISTPGVKVSIPSVTAAQAEAARAQTPYTYGTRKVGNTTVDTVQGNGVSGWR